MMYGKRINLSPQFVLSCNWMNEGCHGGWPINNGVFGKHFYIPDEKCAKYKADTLKPKCGDYAKCKPVAKVKEFYFVGGYYGNASELKMMQELRARGSIVSDFEPPMSFSVYKGGVFSEEHSKVLKDLANKDKKTILSKNNINYRTLMDYHLQW